MTEQPRLAAFAAGNTFDQFMILQVFSDYLEAAEVLGKLDDPFVKTIAETMPKVHASPNRRGRAPAGMAAAV